MQLIVGYSFIGKTKDYDGRTTEKKTHAPATTREAAANKTKNHVQPNKA
jgi:hypothetical protein